MVTISKDLRNAVTAAKPMLLEISSETAESKPNPKAWSFKEIIGHLIDSASNNHQRFVRAAQNVAMDFPPYLPDNWVAVQAYNKSEWSELVDLFCLYNLHLSNVIDRLPKNVLQNPCNIGRESPVTMEWVIRDYLRHLRHHLEKILGQGRI
ncbi:DinB family protein [candidate division KSB1 bacterium]|nr:DinB family protein [candidate division KSB1 bacterium]